MTQNIAVERQKLAVGTFFLITHQDVWCAQRASRSARRVRIARRAARAQRAVRERSECREAAREM